MFNSDLRGFLYPLDPVRRQRQWQLERSIAKLGELRRQLVECISKRDSLAQGLEAQAARTAELWRTWPDPSTYSRFLSYLAVLQGRAQHADLAVAQLKVQVENAVQDCVRHQRRAELLERHRTNAAQFYASEEARRSASEADQDWSARRHLGTSGSVRL